MTEEELKELAKKEVKEVEDFYNKNSMITPLFVAFLILVGFVIIYLCCGLVDWLRWYMIGSMFLIPVSILYPGQKVVSWLWKREQEKKK